MKIMHEHGVDKKNVGSVRANFELLLVLPSDGWKKSFEEEIGTY